MLCNVKISKSQVVSKSNILEAQLSDSCLTLVCSQIPVLIRNDHNPNCKNTIHFADEGTTVGWGSSAYTPHFVYQCRNILGTVLFQCSSRASALLMHVSVKEAANHCCHSSAEPQRVPLCGWWGNDLKVWLNERSTGECDCPSFAVASPFGLCLSCLCYQQSDWTIGRVFAGFIVVVLLKGKIDHAGFVWVATWHCPQLRQLKLCAWVFCVFALQ